MLIAQNIHKSYANVSVLRGIDLSLRAGEVVALVGSSGAGKSTLLQILGTLDSPDKGEILFQDQHILQFSSAEKANFRNKNMGFVFQFHNLLPEFSALENVAMPALIAGESFPAAAAKAEALLTRLGLAHRTSHKPSMLSGGEQQRVSVARALINQPGLILADEPTGNLDSANSEELYKLFLEVASSSGVSFLIATHNPALAARSHRVLHIRDGVMMDS
jgi:lipoprotein-releasing system ATP-binding protein